MDGNYITGGWQFDVFDLGKRVHKKKKRLLRVVRKGKRFILKSGLYVRNPKNLIPRLLAIYFFAPKSTTLMKEKITEFPELSAMFGNPEFLGKNEYTQDKITPLNQVYNQLSLSEKISILKKFVKFTKRMWGYGIADGDLSKFSNFLKNYGLNQKNELVLADLGNLVSNISEATKIIEKAIETCGLIACGEKIKEHLNVLSLKAIWGQLANR